ncbi:MAG: sigma 54-interacting transcriptional regulator [Candidatus Kapabacteria bacterium]|jgi:DNA-binding NtrC family response regulator|nr:sigma 54-interacting transcriptional regulator [Candidatus Kapabacteria bacterium]
MTIFLTQQPSLIAKIMTHPVSFTNARYTNLQTLNLTEHSHLLRSFDTERNEHVLLRVFRTSNEAEQSYILTEAAALAKLASPHIATLYDVNITAHNEPYIAFENLQHIPLDTVPHAQFTTPQFIVQMAASLLSALAPLHAQMRALLCLSPASVRLADEESPVARIALDEWRPIAGGEIARSIYGAHNQYAAPELALQLPPDARADLYSIGITLYEVITGQSFNEMVMVDSAGMLSHLVLKSLRDHAPALPDALVQWIYALLERDRSMRFFSVREALDYLAAHGLLPSEIVSGIEASPVSIIPVNAIGMETAFAAVVNVQSPFVEAPVLEISGEPGLGKTMLLRSLLQSRMQSTTLLRHKIVYAAAKSTHALPEQIAAALAKQEPTLFLVDDTEQMPENARLRAKDLLAQEDTLLAGIRLVATHRSQLPRLATKPTMLTLTHFSASSVPLFCTELLGRCAFTPEFYRNLYAQTKGHPLTLALVVRGMVRNGVVKRRNRIWTHEDSVQTVDFTPLSPGAAAIEEIRSLQTDAQTIMCAVAAIVRVTEDATGTSPEQTPFPVSLHLLAEMLDTSTQSALRRLLPLIFDGYVHLHNSAIEWTHEIFRETAQNVLPSEELQHFEALAQGLLQHRFSHTIPPKTAPNLAPKELAPKELVPKQRISKELTPSSPEQDAPQPKPQVIPHAQGMSETPALMEAPTQASEETTTPQTIEAQTILPENMHQHQPQSALPLFFVGTSSATALFRKNVELAAQHDVPCLIESVYGSEREGIAAYIHAHSLRRNRPFHTISCTDFDALELEEYLFGTGTAKGLFAASEGGMILLDEISAVPTTLQTRLARFSQAQRKHNKALPAPARQPANHDVRLLVGFTISGGIRADAAMRSGVVANELFFAFSGMRVVVPSLAERPQDAPLLAEAYCLAIGEEYGIPFVPRQIPSAFWNNFATKSWIADTTELEANCRSLVLQFDASRADASLQSLSEAIFSSASMPTLLAPAATSPSIGKATPSMIPSGSEADDDNLLSIDDAQKEHILRAMELTGGNKTKAAEMLKIKRTTLLARMKKFGLMP